MGSVEAPGEAIVLTGYAVDPSIVRGGAQRVAAELCDRLVELGWTVRVIECTVWKESIEPTETIASGMGGQVANSQTWRGCDPPAALLPPDVDRAVRRAGLVLAMDRAVGRLATAAHRVLLLSNLAYENERRAVAHGDHDAVWVPSLYLAEQVGAAASEAPATRHAIEVHVVPPALTLATCDELAHRPLRRLRQWLGAAAIPRHRRLLFPHRTDPEKGLSTALAVLAELSTTDRWALVAIEPDPREGADSWAFVESARTTVHKAGLAERVHWVPWLPQPEVFCLYDLVGVTLMPTQLDESFGLVAAESVWRGVPVVARPSGNLTVLARGCPAVHLADGTRETARTAAAITGRAVPSEQRDAIGAAFSISAQRAAVTAALLAGGAAA